MKHGFYMGYDASKLTEGELVRQARLLLDRGFYSAGYNVLRLGRVDGGRFSDLAKLAAALRAMGFQLDIAVKGDRPAEAVLALVEETGARQATVEDDGRGEAGRLVEALKGKVRLALGVRDGRVRGDDGVDVTDLDLIRDTDDFFEITRNRLDSCREGDVDVGRSEANLRRAAAGAGGAWYPGSLPLRFDAHRNAAIFLQFCMLGCPLVLEGDLADMPEATRRLVCRGEYLEMASRGSGGVARYYDPWHALLTKPVGEDRAYAMILNRCHGDQPTNILPGDLGWSGRFALVELPERELVGANLETFEVHVETSDHPQTPCCRLYMAERL